MSVPSLFFVASHLLLPVAAGGAPRRHSSMESVRRSERKNAGSRMNNVTVSLPLNMKRMVAMRLLFCGHLFAYLPPRPLGEALDVNASPFLALTLSCTLDWTWT